MTGSGQAPTPTPATPVSLLAKLQKRWTSGSARGRTVRNIAWLFADRAVFIVASIVVGAWMARFLGPTRYGLLSYCMAVAALPSPLSTAGINQVVVRNFVTAAHPRSETMGSAVVVRIGGVALHVLVALVLAIALRPGDGTTLLFVALFASGYVFRVFDVLDFWFQSRVEARYVVWANTTATVVVAILRVALILMRASLVFFVVTFPLQMLVGAAALFRLYLSHGKDRPRHWQATRTVLRALLKDSAPLFVSGLAVILYVKVDQVMIGQMLGNRELGQYSAAVRISEAWNFIPIAIGTSVLPGLVRARQRSQELYLARVQQLLDAFFWASAIIALVVTLTAGLIIRILFGAAYAPAASVLVVHIWSAVFVFWGVAGSQYLVAENLTRTSLHRTVFGLIVNVALNVFWIPRYGIMGAAWATLIAYMSSGWLAHALLPEVRGLFWMQVKSLNPIRALAGLRGLWEEE
jgi:PST family polysaccharide transporter